MPQLKHTFTSGKMNKDLDERLVQNGEYIDALNIQVGHSEGSDLGAIENILGNTAQSTLGLTNATVIGSIRHNSTNCIYWFITADGVDCIAEYNQTTDTVSPVIVDKTSVLNFSTSYLITGINILENILLWTDGLNQPCKINITTFKAGSTNFNTHTKVYGSTRAFVLADVKVIKRGPTVAPTVNVGASRRIHTVAAAAVAGVGCGINPVTLSHNFTTNPGTGGFFKIKDIGTSVSMTTVFNGSKYPNWFVGDVIGMEATKLDDKNFTNEYQVRITVTAISYDTTALTTTVVGDILTISPNITDNTFEWECLLEEEDPMFALDFPRFAYRWEYTDGEISTYSPFSKVAFVPGPFGYSSAESFNGGMNNNLRYLMLNGFETAPSEVSSIDILYKGSRSNVIYRIENRPRATTSYVVTSELIGDVIDSTQLLRPWDNVPLTAKAQESSANRVLYGNYTQGYDMTISGTLVQPQVTAGHISTTHTSVVDPLPSVKAQRSYQLGVVYGDTDGRESPVFTSSQATTAIEKKNSKKTNAITAEMTTSPPDWATYFKYFIKDIANEYYNIAMDRFYVSVDGNLWLSFPSAERNKVKEGGYLTIKKEHDAEVSVDEPARYKVLDISNETPRDVLYKREPSAFATITFGAAPRPQSGSQEFSFYGPTAINNPKFFSAIESTAIVRFWDNNNVSDFYEVIEGGEIDGAGTYRVKLEREIDAADNWLNTVATAKFKVYTSEPRHKKEYTGKFFVKINRDPTFDDAIINPLVQKDPAYVRTSFGEVADVMVDDPTDSFAEHIGVFAFTEHANAYAVPGMAAPTAGSATFGVGFAPFRDGLSSGAIVNTTATTRLWFDMGLSVGNFIKFTGDSSGTYYEISGVVENTTNRLGTPVSPIEFQHVIKHKVITLTATVTGNFTTTGISVYDKDTSWGHLLDENSTILSSATPAIFETEPSEPVDLDFYFEATDAFPIAQHAQTKTLDWFNCYSFGNGVESDRIRDDFNAARIGRGVKVSAPLDEPYAREHKKNGLIFSGIFNSTSGVNKLNQFALAEPITKDLNPLYGSIQRLHARDTDMIVLCEDKILRVLSNKDALYNADGNANITSNRAVLGQTVPFVGEFGISKNPESFASYGFRAYFSDKSRGVVLRLSRDGLTEISNAGMSDFFVDNLRSASTVIGSFDDQTNCYNITLNGKTASFKENVRGWPTLKSFIPESGLSLNNTYYTFKNGELYSHDNANRNTFYGAATEESSVTFMINDAPSNIKNYQTLSYEGSAGWTTPSIETDQQSGRVLSFLEKEGIWYNYIKGLDTTWDNDLLTGSLDTKEFSVQGIGTVGDVTNNIGSLSMEMNVDINVSLQANAGDIIFFKDISAGKTVKVGQCTAISGSLITCTHTVGQPIPEDEVDFIFFAKNSEVNTSGIVGYYAETKMEVTSSSMKELFAVNAQTFISS